MKKRTYMIVASLIGISWILYAASLWLGDKWGDITAPLPSLSVSTVLAVMFFRFRNMRAVWLMSALSVFAWFITDVLWAIYSLVLNSDPNESLLIAFAYLMTNLFMAIAAAFLLFSRHNTWHRLQMIMDMLAVSFVGLTSVWILFIRGSFQALVDVRSEDFVWNLITFGYGVTDIFIIGCLILWATTIEKVKVPRQLNYFLGGFISYAICDLIFCVQYFQNSYNDNTWLDICYQLSFVLIGIGALKMIYIGQEIIPSKSVDQTDNLHSIRRSTILLLIPFLLFFIPSIKFGWTEFIFLLSILVIHQVFSSYFASARINARLLEHEKQMNKILEEQIAMRTRELMAINKELEKVSNHDSITNFYNRRFFMIRFDNMLKEAEKTELVALFFADLDRFKAINDTFGHDVGDKVLVEIARRMTDWNSYQATIARLGGDEFVVAIRGQYGFDDIAGIAEKLIRRCSEPIVIPPYQFHVTISVGITLYPTDAQEHITMLKNADIAMYHAKAQGCNQFAFFSTLINEQVSRRTELEKLIRKADYEQEFAVHYQPQFLTSGELIGFEALLHWNSPKLGLVSPEEFVPIAEESGQVIPLGEWVMQKAATQIAGWNSQYSQQLRMGINISPKQLESVHFLEKVDKIIHFAGVQPNWLDFEVSESFALKSDSPIAVVLQELSDLGVNISVDDFGTGYSSLSYLKRFPIDRLKIARILTENISEGGSDYQIIKAILMVARAMGIETVAEGVENQEQLSLLAELECDAVQGFLLGRPMSASDAEAVFLHKLLPAIKD